jgi:hypothetical protein
MCVTPRSVSCCKECQFVHIEGVLSVWPAQHTRIYIWIKKRQIYVCKEAQLYVHQYEMCIASRYLVKVKARAPGVGPGAGRLPRGLLVYYSDYNRLSCHGLNSVAMYCDHHGKSSQITDGTDHQRWQYSSPAVPITDKLC